MGTCHKLVAGVRSPCKITLSSCLTMTVSEVKETTQPASQSCPMESNEWDFKSGAMCTVRAEVGKPGMWISPSCVLCMVDPLGLRIAIGEELMRRFRTGRSWKKSAVLPVSATTLVVVGGPKDGIGCNSTNLHAGFKPDEAMFELVLVGASVSFPRFQALKRGRRGLGCVILLLPPSMLLMVASVLCSAPG
jgi:hypothetical protein